MSTKLTDTLQKKWDIAQRISEECNDKRFKWEKKDDITFELGGLPNNVQCIYQDARNDKNPKGFRLLKNKRTIAGPTLNVGVFLKELKPIMQKVMEPEQATQEA